jgi:hypothetical protein
LGLGRVLVGEELGKELALRSRRRKGWVRRRIEGGLVGWTLLKLFDRLLLGLRVEAWLRGSMG